jgi:post-segregation antitoxin (ccd killing protein)
MWEEARARGINVSAASEQGLRTAIELAQEKLNEENAKSAETSA